VRNSSKYIPDLFCEYGPWSSHFYTDRYMRTFFKNPLTNCVLFYKGEKKIFSFVLVFILFLKLPVYKFQGRNLEKTILVR